MTVPDNRTCYSLTIQRNYNSCSWFGLLAIDGGLELIDQYGNRIAPAGLIVAGETRNIFHKVLLMERYRARGYVTAEELEEYQLTLDPEEWEFDYDSVHKKVKFRTLVPDAHSRKSAPKTAH